MINKFALIALIALYSIAFVSAISLSDNHVEGIAKISRQIPNLNYSLEKGVWAKLHDGKATKRSELSTFLVFAVLESNPLIFVDLNKDGLVDALVVIRVTYTGIGYFDLFAVPVLMHHSGKAYVPCASGFRIGETSVYTLASFDIVGNNNMLRIAFLDRKPGEPKVIAPSVPTILTLRYDSRRKSLIAYSKRIIKKCVYYEVFGRL